MKNLNTQLASWTHLRSATVLYAKQSYTGDVLCSYPFGFVEPRPEFFLRLKTLATRSAVLFAALPMKGSYTYQRGWDPRPAVISLELLKSYEVDFMNRFASTMGLLEAITGKELAQTPLSASESSFLRDLIEHQSDYAGYRTYGGWYPGLFYRNIMAPQYSSIPPGKQCDTWDALVTDVHTDVPAPLVGDPGCVLHEAVGNVWMLVVAVNNGPDNLIYAGPVFSHYEFEQPADKRLTETEWKTMILGNRMPPAPAWVDSYRVPGVYRVPSVIARE